MLNVIITIPRKLYFIGCSLRESIIMSFRYLTGPIRSHLSGKGGRIACKRDNYYPPASQKP